MKKLILILLMSFASMMLLMGCSDKYPEFLTENNWKHDNQVCAESISFNEDGEFVYSEACGSPVGDYDLYDKYKYDEKTNTITLIPCESGNEEEVIEVIHYDDSSLLLKIDGKVKEFYTDERIPNIGYEAGDQFVDYIKGFSGYCAFLKIEDGKIYVGTSEYDGDVHGEDIFVPYALAKDAKFESLHIEKYHKGDTEKTNYDYDKLTETQVKENFDIQVGIGFVWINENLEVEKILFYGMTEVWE